MHKPSLNPVEKSKNCRIIEYLSSWEIRIGVLTGWDITMSATYFQTVKQQKCK